MHAQMKALSAMALRRAGLGAGALNRDDSRAARVASATLRSRLLAAQVRMHAANARDQLLLGWSCSLSTFFRHLQIAQAHAHESTHRARALRAEEI